MGGRSGKTRPTAPVDTDTALTALETITRARLGQASRREGMASLKELGDYARQAQCAVARRTRELKNLQKATRKGRTPTKHG